MSDLEILAKGTGADARQARRTLKRRGRASGTIADFSALEQELDDLASRLEPGERKRVAGAIATSLRASQAARIKANVTPEGEPMVPRKQRPAGKDRTRRLRDELTRKRTRIRGGAMFLRATAPRYLRKESSQGEAAVGFVGAMARIMSVHQYGLEDSVSRDPGSPRVVYPVRTVIGLTADDRARILELVSAHFA